MFAGLKIKSQTTFTANLLVSDSSHTKFTRADSVTTKRLRVTDTICTTKNICIQNDARVSGDVRVVGDVMFNNTSMGMRSFTHSAFANLKFINIGAESDLSKIPAIACMTISQYAGNSSFLHQPGGGFVSSHGNQSFVFYQAPWGQAHIETEGAVPNNAQNGNPLLVNYFCGNDIALGGTSISNPNKYSKIFLERFVRAMKHVEIGDSVNGIVNDNNNIGLLVHTHSGAGVKVRTYHQDLNAISIQNTGSQAPDNFNGLHSFMVKGSGETQIMVKGYKPALTIRTFNNASSTPTVFQVMGDGKTYIGAKKVVTTHSDAMLHVDGKAACKSLYVLKPTNWADHVFSDKFQYDLNEIENFIIKNKHLPGVPSENEILQNGYDVNEMNAILLKKIEELYLIIIDLNKSLEQLKK
ncbi:MAG: hypothetical protein N3F09_08755 [Bacteroidia bacterium]|nr:hypothetical protein [Bacteroidia bacterium]